MTGRVDTEWRTGVPLEITRIKQAVLHWRGGVRYGGADVTLVGVLAPSPPAGGTAGDPEPAPAGTARKTAELPLLRATGTNQPFRLRVGRTGVDLSGLRAGETYRVTGQVVNSEEGKEHEIVLEVAHAEPVGNER